MEYIVGIIGGLIAVGIAIWFYIVLPAQMAETRGRSAIGWVLVSLIFTPILAILLLLLLGDAK